MNKKSLLLCIAAAAIPIALTTLAYAYYNVYDRTVMAFDFEVSDRPLMSFNLDKDAIHFGSIPVGSSGIRNIILESDRGSFVIIKPMGTDYLTASKNYFVMPANKPTEIELIVDVPLDAKVGKYEGKLLITLKKAKNS